MCSYCSKEDLRNTLYTLSLLVMTIDSLVAQLPVGDSDKITKDLIRKILNTEEFYPVLLNLVCNKETVEKVVSEDEYLRMTLSSYLKDILSTFSKLSNSCIDLADSSSTSQLLAEEEYNVIRKLTQLGLDEEGAKEILKRTIGKEVSIKDFVNDSLREVMIKKYSDEFIASVLQSCRSSYCVATKISTLWSKILDLEEILGWNPKDAFRKALFNPNVLREVQNVVPILGGISFEISKPHFNDLRAVKDIIEQWVAVCRTVFRERQRHNFEKGISSPIKQTLGKKHVRTVSRERDEIPITTLLAEDHDSSTISSSTSIPKDSVAERKPKKRNYVKAFLAIVMILLVVSLGYAYYASLGNTALPMHSTMQASITTLTHQGSTPVSSSSLNESNTAFSPTYVMLSLSRYLENATAIGHHVFIDEVPSNAYVQGVPFQLAFQENKQYFKDVRVSDSGIIVIPLNKPINATTLYLLLAVHNTCIAHCSRGTRVGEVIVVHEDKSIEKLNLSVGINIDEWRKGKDTELCHPFPWLKPVLSGKLIYVDANGVKIPSTWNIYLVTFKLQIKSSPVIALAIRNLKQDAPITLFAATFSSS